MSSPLFSPGFVARAAKRKYPQGWSRIGRRSRSWKLVRNAGYWTLRTSCGRTTEPAKASKTKPSWTRAKVDGW